MPRHPNSCLQNYQVYITFISVGALLIPDLFKAGGHARQLDGVEPPLRGKQTPSTRLSQQSLHNTKIVYDNVQLLQ